MFYFCYLGVRFREKNVFVLFPEKNRKSQKSSSKCPSTGLGNSNRIIFMFWRLICCIYYWHCHMVPKKIILSKKVCFMRKFGTIPQAFWTFGSLQVQCNLNYIFHDHYLSMQKLCLSKTNDRTFKKFQLFVSKITRFRKFRPIPTGSRR